MHASVFDLELQIRLTALASTLRDDIRRKQTEISIQHQDLKQYYGDKKLDLFDASSLGKHVSKKR